jgi:hypothetical protein
MDQDFLRVLLFLPVNIVATIFSTYLHQHVDPTRRSSWRRVDTVQNAVLFFHSRTMHLDIIKVFTPNDTHVFKKGY